MNIIDIEEFKKEGHHRRSPWDVDDYFNSVNTRNDLLKRMIKSKAPKVMVDNQKIMLRKAVDRLLNYLDTK